MLHSCIIKSRWWPFLARQCIWKYICSDVSDQCSCLMAVLRDTLNQRFSVAFSIIGMFSSHAVSTLSIFYCAEITPTVIRYNYKCIKYIMFLKSIIFVLASPKIILLSIYCHLLLPCTQFLQHVGYRVIFSMFSATGASNFEDSRIVLETSRRYPSGFLSLIWELLWEFVLWGTGFFTLSDCCAHFSIHTFLVYKICVLYTFNSLVKKSNEVLSGFSVSYWRTIMVC